MISFLLVQGNYTIHWQSMSVESFYSIREEQEKR
jgi:hypothetical protein